MAQMTAEPRNGRSNYDAQMKMMTTGRTTGI